MRHPLLTRAVLLVAHGSRDPRAAGVVTRLADAVRRELACDRGTRVEVAYLDFTAPSVGAALSALAADGVADVTVVPLLFAPGYHLRVDLPAAVAEVRAGRPELAVTIAEPLAAPPEVGEPDPLLAALESGLGQPPDAYDAVVLASAGSSDPLSRKAIEALAGRWSTRSGRPVLPSYATGVGLRVDAAIDRLRSQGAARVAVSSLFLAPGRLPEAVRRAALASGAVTVAGPLGADPHLVRLVANRAERARPHSLLAR